MSLYTVQQAIEIRCCGTEGCGAIVFSNSEVTRHCIGDKCMAWRFVKEKVPLTDEQAKAARTAIVVAQALQPDVQPARGYCGLAGHHD